MSDDKPKRACVLTLKMEADTRADMASALFNIADLIERGELTVGASGGVNSGAIYEYIESDKPTHEEYFIALQKYLDGKRKV